MSTAAGRQPPQPLGPPIEQLAADLRRLLRLHESLTVSAHLAMRAHRLWAVEAAIGMRAVEAARALDIAHREPERPGALTRDELLQLLTALAAAGLVLPAKVGPFTSTGDSEPCSSDAVPHLAGLRASGRPFGWLPWRNGGGVHPPPFPSRHSRATMTSRRHGGHVRVSVSGCGAVAA